jgi:hypothetical protein
VHASHRDSQRFSYENRFSLHLAGSTIPPARSPRENGLARQDLMRRLRTEEREAERKNETQEPRPRTKPEQAALNPLGANMNEALTLTGMSSNN